MKVTGAASKKAFTLVELSIVLVIIGLLTGGILGAQALVKAAKINGVVSDMSQYNVGVASFKTIYKAIPGDSNAFPYTISSTTFNGNENGIYDNSEPIFFWYQLTQGADFKTKSGQDYLVEDAGANMGERHCPEFNLNQQKSPDRRSCLGVSRSTISGQNKNHFVYTNFWGGFNFSSAQDYDPLLISDAAAIDKKMDDGRPLSGKVTGLSWGYNNTEQCVNGTAYNNSAKTHSCTLYFESDEMNN